MRVAIVGLGTMGRIWHRVLTRMGVDVVTIDLAGHGDYLTTRGLRADAWVIATPPDRLSECAHRIKGRILVEKPGAHDLPPCSVGYVERFNPAFQELRRQAGEVTAVRAERLGPARASTSPTVDLATHDLDLMEALGLDRTPIATRATPGHTQALLACGAIEASHLHPVKVRRIRITGTPNLDADLIRQRVWVDGQEVEVTKAEPLALQARAFLDGTLPVDEHSASETLKLAEEIDACAIDRSVPQTQPRSSPASSSASRISRVGPSSSPRSAEAKAPKG